MARRRTLQRIVAVIASTAITLLLLEVVFRAMGYGNIVLYRPSPAAGWEHQPRQRARTRVGGLPITINALGLRGADVTRTKPAGTIRILAFGDSSTFGWGVRDEDTYPARLEEILRLELAGRRVEVLNGGVNGYSVVQERAALAARAIELRPDLAIVSHTWNESWTRPEPAKAMFRVRLTNLLRRSATFHFVRDFRLADLTDRFLDAQWESQPPAAALDRHEAELERIVEFAATERLPLLFVSLASRGQTQLTPIQQVMARVAASRGVPFVNVVDAFRASPRDDLFLDPVHPSAAGHAVLARTVAPAVIERLAEAGVVRRSAR